MSYLSYTEYTTYGGSLLETAFSRLEFKAEKKIDGATFGRLKSETTIPEAVKRLTFELVNLISNNDYSAEDYSPAVSSEGNDGYSVSFANGTVLSVDEAERRMKLLIEEYLDGETNSAGIPLLYCGYNGL